MAKPVKPAIDDLRHALNASLPNSAVAIDRVMRAVLEPMCLLLYPPFDATSEDELLRQSAIALEGYVEDLAEFDPPTLAGAWRVVRRSHKVQRWPTIEALRSAALEIRGERGGAGGASNPHGWRTATNAELEILSQAGGRFAYHTRVNERLLEEARGVIVARERQLQQPLLVA